MTTVLLDLLGILFGLAGAGLGVVMLASEHRTSPLVQRYTIGTMTALNGVVAIDSAWSLHQIGGDDFSPGSLAVCFSMAITVNWAYRARRHLRRVR